MKPRRAGPGDAAAIRALTREAYGKWIAVIGREPWPMRADYDKAVRDHSIDLIEDTLGLAGLIEMIPGEGFLLIENIAVRGDRQGSGLGGQLLAHAEAVARAAGLAEIRLYTNAAFAGNITYYPKRGFRETGRAGLPGGGSIVHFSKLVS